MTKIPDKPTRKKTNWILLLIISAIVIIPNISAIISSTICTFMCYEDFRKGESIGRITFHIMLIIILYYFINWIIEKNKR